MSSGGGQHVETIAGTPQDVLDAVLDFESYPEWQSAVRECRILERTPDGRPSVVETVIDAKVRRVRYVLRYHLEGTERLWWEFVEGDVKSVTGEYRFEELADGSGTRTTYALGIDAGVFVPGPLRKFLTETAMKASLREVKARVESGTT